ncbi:MAG TPA: hypothetical protein VKQ54_03670 [Caulobacteraceae bacterium]|nr:hypothetical protein [Caulobacteraceae bacterium]
MSALVIAAVLAATPIGPQPCANAFVQPTASAGAPPARKLGDLPPARLMHLVLRRVDGCELAEVRQPTGAWTNVPAGVALFSAEPARRAPSGDRAP